MAREDDRANAPGNPARRGGAHPSAAHTGRTASSPASGTESGRPMSAGRTEPSVFRDLGTDEASALRAGIVQSLGDRLGPAVTMATTEHFNLQTARAATISEANGRASVYLAAVSSTLIALAFIGQMSRLGAGFYALALLLLPVLAFVGAVTFQRLVQCSLEDMAYAQRIARLRSLYLALAPELEPYLLVQRGKRAERLLSGGRLRPTRWQLTLTTAGMVAVVNSIVIGASAGLVLATPGDVPLAVTLAPRRGIGAIGALAPPPTRGRRLRASDDRSVRHTPRRHRDGRRWVHR
jgi:hypothetical protein